MKKVVGSTKLRLFFCIGLLYWSMIKLLNVVRRLWGLLVINPDKPLPKPVARPLEWIYYKFFRGAYERTIVSRLEYDVSSSKRNYVIQIERIRTKIRKRENIRVLFIVNELSKWKAKSLYFALMQSDGFEPMIGLTCPSVTIGVTPRQTDATIKKNLTWFVNRGYKCVELYDAFRAKPLPLKRFNPDIVFYPEVWYDLAAHSPTLVSRFALTCYIPYFVPNYVDVDLDCLQDMHRLYWRHIVLNKELARLYASTTNGRTMAGEFVGLGHTMFDEIKAALSEVHSNEEKKCIIYAPHWTFTHPGNITTLHYSTFAELGEVMLRYAKEHSEFLWVFKPHPCLYDHVVQSGMMSKHEIDDYYAAWSRLGEVVQTAGYAELFAKSYAMITDCGSFLSEYGATGRPIIHLISPNNNRVPPPIIKKVYDSYYQVHDATELWSVCEMVLEKGQDPNKGDRLAALIKAGFCGQDAAKNIVDYLVKMFQ